MRKVLILGATGFIGGHITRKALQSGWEVFGFRRHPTRTGHLGSLPVHWLEGDLTDRDSLVSAMEGKDVVFHAAAFYPKEGGPRKVPAQVAYAIEEISNVIDAVKRVNVDRLIYTSSLTTIGIPPDSESRLADERDFYIPGTVAKSGYYESKIVMEQLVFDACNHGLPAVILNPTAVFGPGEVYPSMGSLLISVARGWMVGWLPGNVNVVDVRDVAQAHISAAKIGQIGERYIIGGYNYSVRDAFNIVASITGSTPPRFEIPLRALQFLTLIGELIPALPLPTNHLRGVHLWQGYNIQKARKKLGYSPRPFEETVRDSIVWFKENGLM